MMTADTSPVTLLEPGDVYYDVGDRANYYRVTAVTRPPWMVYVTRHDGTVAYYHQRAPIVIVHYAGQPVRRKAHR